MCHVGRWQILNFADFFIIKNFTRRLSAWLTGSAAWLDHIFGLCVFFFAQSKETENICSIRRRLIRIVRTAYFQLVDAGISPKKYKVLESRYYCEAERGEFNKFDRMKIMRPMANWCNFFHLQFRKLCFNWIQQTGNSRARKTNILAELPCNEIFKFMSKLSSLTRTWPGKCMQCSNSDPNYSQRGRLKTADDFPKLSEIRYKDSALTI